MTRKIVRRQYTGATFETAKNEQGEQGVRCKGCGEWVATRDWWKHCCKDSVEPAGLAEEGGDAAVPF